MSKLCSFYVVIDENGAAYYDVIFIPPVISYGKNVVGIVTADNKEELKKIKILRALPIPAKTKIDRISEEVCRYLADDEEYCVRITLQTQLLLERDDMYLSDYLNTKSKIAVI